MMLVRICLFITLSALLIIKCSPVRTLSERGICAHRGANNTHPENTLVAFKEAIRLGAHMIEFDVQMTKDSVLVIIHDDTLSRTTNGQGNVSDFALAELKKLDAGFWKDPKYKGEKIPTLNEVMEIMPKNVWINIHIKVKTKTGAAFVGKAVADLIINNEQLNQAVIACKTEVREAIHKVDSSIKICNMERLENSKIYVDETISMKADFIQLKSRADSLMPELSQKLKENGIKINYFGLRQDVKKWSFGSLKASSKDKLEQIYNMGVEFPMVDELDKMIIAAYELGINPVKPEY